MSTENIRVNELARDLQLTSKEVIEKFAELSITVKSHSSTVTPEQVKKIKDYINAGSKIEVKKPKAFIVKKAKPEPTEKPEEKPEEKQEIKKTSVSVSTIVKTKEETEEAPAKTQEKTEEAIS